jgi:hypothetical protein
MGAAGAVPVGRCRRRPGQCGQPRERPSGPTSAAPASHRHSGQPPPGGGPIGYLPAAPAGGGRPHPLGRRGPAPIAPGALLRPAPSVSPPGRPAPPSACATCSPSRTGWPRPEGTRRRWRTLGPGLLDLGPPPMAGAIVARLVDRDVGWAAAPGTCVGRRPSACDDRRAAACPRLRPTAAALGVAGVVRHVHEHAGHEPARRLGRHARPAAFILTDVPPAEAPRPPSRTRPNWRGASSRAPGPRPIRPSAAAPAGGLGAGPVDREVGLNGGLGHHLRRRPLCATFPRADGRL